MSGAEGGDWPEAREIHLRRKGLDGKLCMYSAHMEMCMIHGAYIVGFFTSGLKKLFEFYNFIIINY